MNRLLLLTVALTVVSDPSPQIVLPCRVVSVHDGDTVTVEVTMRANVRLLDCWAPELRDVGGMEARDEAVKFAAGKRGSLTIPLGDDLGDSLSFGRLLGRISIDEVDMSEHLISKGFATREKVR